MLRFLYCFMALSGATFVAGCTGAQAGVGLPRAVIYHDYTVPLGVNVDPERPWMTNTDPNLPVAKASTHSVSLNVPGVPPPLGYAARALSVGWGEMDLDEFTDKGNLERVAWADARHVSILGIYNKLTINAYGPPGVEPNQGAVPEVAGN